MSGLLDGFNWVFLCIVTYVFMRAFEVEFAASRERPWYRVVVKLVAGATLVVAALSVVAILREGSQTLITKKQQDTATTGLSPDESAMTPPPATADGGALPDKP